MCLKLRVESKVYYNSLLSYEFYMSLYKLCKLGRFSEELNLLWYLNINTIQMQKNNVHGT